VFVDVAGPALIVMGWLVGAAGIAQIASTSDPLAQLTGYGALGLVVLGAVLGQIRFKPEVATLRDAADARDREHAEERRRMQAQIDTLLEVQQTQVLPALFSSAEALRASATQASSLVAALERVEAAITRVESTYLRMQQRPPGR
jgi:hypothetical protein